MAFNIPGLPFKLTAQDMGGVDLTKSILGGLHNYNQFEQARYAPEMMQAQVNKLKADAQKNMMLSQLFGSIMGGDSGPSLGGGEGAGGNLKAAVLKAFTGIDPYLMSPQQEQDLKIAGSLQQQAKKTNLNTGASDISREFLQNKVSMPERYMGTLGSYNMIRDRALAQKGDEAAKERLIQAAVSEKLVPEYSGFQLMSQGQKATVPALKHQQDAIRQGWPRASHLITNNLPPEIQKEAERRHNEIVRQVNKRREEFLSSGGRNTQQNNDTSSDFSEQEINAEAKYFKTSPEIIRSAIAAGVKTEKELKDWIKGLQK